MEYILSEISRHLYLNLIPFYCLLIISILSTLSLKKATSCKNNYFALWINGFSIIAILSQYLFLGVLIDNQITISSTYLQIIVLSVLLLINFLFSIFIFLKQKKSH